MRRYQLPFYICYILIFIFIFGNFQHVNKGGVNIMVPEIIEPAHAIAGIGENNTIHI